MLPAEDRRGEVPPVSTPGEWVTTISAPWSTRALAVSLKVSLWLSICRVWRRRNESEGHGCSSDSGSDRCVCVCASFYHDVAPPRSVGGVAQRADLGLGLILKVQLHTVDAHVTAPWEQDREKRQRGIARLQLLLRATLRAKNLRGNWTTGRTCRLPHTHSLVWLV